MQGSKLKDYELEALGVKRSSDRFGARLYRRPCAACGGEVRSRHFNTDKAYLCNLCKHDVVKRRKAADRALAEQIERAMAEGFGVDYTHYRRFENAAAKFGDSYIDAIELARKSIEKFDSVPEAVACIELLHIGARVIVHQPVGDFTVDFYLPDEKVVIEIDGSLYHKDADKQWMRDYALDHMLDGALVRHVPSDSVMKNHAAFGGMMRRLIKQRREELGIKKRA